MSKTDAEARSAQAADAARARWEREGNPVLTRSVETVITRAGELSGVQRAAIEAAISLEADGR